VNVLFASNRTDNAVKNRFSTLCKRRANNDDLFEENTAVCSNANAKRVLTQTGGLTRGAPSSSPPIKNMRYTLYQQKLLVNNANQLTHIYLFFSATRSCKLDFKENVAQNTKSFGQEKSIGQDSRQPLADLCPPNQSVNIVETQNSVTRTSAKQLYGEEQSCEPTILDTEYLM
jgi:myb proto-oncogene protein